MGTVDAVVEDFRRHGLVIWALAFGSLLAYIALGIANAWILGVYVAILAQILTYGVMEGKADVKRAARQALLAWIASIVVGIALILAASVAALVAFALAGVSTALAVASMGAAVSWLIVYHEAESNEKRVESNAEAVA